MIIVLLRYGQIIQIEISQIDQYSNSQQAKAEASLLSEIFPPVKLFIQKQESRKKQYQKNLVPDLHGNKSD